MGNDRIKKKFDDIDGKISLIIEYCRSLEVENKTLLLKISNLEADLSGKRKAEAGFSEQETFILSKTEGLIAKLNNFSNSLDKAESSNR